MTEIDFNRGGRLRVAVGMSGGVDSSMAAALLKQWGHDVVGLTLLLREDAVRCVSEADVSRAAEVAAFLGIEHHALDARRPFEETVVRYFVDEYARGRTPSPCCLCNPMIKFGWLAEKGRELDCGFIATGHYVRTLQRDDGWHLLRAKDRTKDQSYFLHRLTQGQLATALFPLGQMRKRDIWIEAKQRGLPVALNSESQDLCFISGGDYAPFVEKARPELRRAGEIRDSSGRVLGTHEGFHRYTVGQRKGLGVAAKEPLYVSGVDAAQNVVVVGERDAVTRGTCRVEDINWILGRPPREPFACGVRVRYRHDAQPATVSVDGRDGAQVTFDQPQFAITPGQAAVFFDGDEVLGGGWIV